MKDHSAALVDRYFGRQGGELCLSGQPVTQLAAKFGTPLFIYDKAVLYQKWQMVRETLPEVFKIFYSVKANPNQAILRFCLEQGCGLEVASGGEFYRAVKAGALPENIIFAGPGKTESELELVLKQGIGEIHIESSLEAHRIIAICRRLGLTARVSIRVNPLVEVQGGAMRMGGKSAPFGIDEEQVDPLIDELVQTPCLEFRGIHLFTGTQILDDQILLAQYRHSVKVARRIAARLGRPLRTVDLGGGLGIPYFSHEQPLNMNSVREHLAGLMAEISQDPLFAETQFIVEPGRYLVGEAGIYVTRITDIKVSRGKKFLVVDGGMHHHLAASGNLGQVIKRNFPIALLSRLDQEQTDTVDIVGPLCTPLDTLARELPIAHAEVGDLIGIFQSGAYARWASPLGFLSHPTPAEVLVSSDDAVLITRRGTYDDLFQDIP